MNKIDVGYARTEITPPVGTWMMGYAARTSGSEGVHDPLFADVVTLSHAAGKAALVALDVSSLDVEGADDLRGEVARATGIGSDRVIVNTSHTHAGPMVGRRPYGRYEADCLQEIVRKVAAAAGEAMDDLTPASLQVGAAPLDIGCSRREKAASGEVKIGVDPHGPRLSEVAVWRLSRGEADDIVIFSTPIHAAVLGAENLLLSAEWCGMARREIELAVGNASAVFLQGCCGDQCPYRDPRTFAVAEQRGRETCAAVLDALGKMRQVDPLPLVTVRSQIALPMADGSAKDCPICGLRLGEAALVGIAGEVFVQYALFGRDRPGFASTLVLGYTNGSIGYLPTAEAFAEGGYEPNAYQHMPGGRPLDPSVETALTDGIARMLGELSAGT